MQEAEAGRLEVQGQPGLKDRFKASLGSAARSCLKIKFKKYI